jgi:hypothetical protein
MAIKCGWGYGAQNLMRERNRDVPEELRMLFRIGINLGDVLIDGDDILGDGVNIAVGDRALDLAIKDVDARDRDPERSCDRLGRTLARSIGVSEPNSTATRRIFAAVPLSTLSHLPPISGSKARKVAARPREVCHKAAVDGLVRGVVCRLQNMYWPPFKWMACPLTKLPVVQR